MDGKVFFFLFFSLGVYGSVVSDTRVFVLFYFASRLFSLNSFSRGEASLPPVCCRLRGGDHGESLEMGVFFSCLHVLRSCD